MIEQRFEIGYLSSEAAEVLERNIKKELAKAFPYEPFDCRINRGIKKASVLVWVDSPRSVASIKAFYLALVRAAEDARVELLAIRAMEGKFRPWAEKALKEFCDV